MAKREYDIEIDDIFGTGTLPEAVMAAKSNEQVTTQTLHDFLRGRFSKDESMLVRVRIALRKEEKSQNETGNMIFNGLMLAAGVLVFTICLFFDYTILSEFWALQMLNEFYEVPAELLGTIWAKSGQVLIAVIGLHYFMSMGGPVFRAIYTWFAGLMAIALVLGYGTLYAIEQAPAGTEIFGIVIEEEAPSMSVNDELAALGLSTEEPERDSGPEFTDEERRETAQIVGTIWFMAMGVIFFVVSSVGAISLHYAIGGVEGLLNRHFSADWSGGSGRKLSESADRLLELREIEKVLGNPTKRANRYRNMAAQFVTDFRAAGGQSRNLDATSQEIQKLWNKELVAGLMGEQDEH